MHGSGYFEFTERKEKSRDAEPYAKDWNDMVQLIGSSPLILAARPHGPDAELAQAARDMEASFLSIMLREAGMGAPRSAFGGGSGEEQFTSFLTDAYAAKMAESGGIGLAERLFHALKETGNERD
jgi:Rod binding domain-containing protein